MCYSINSDLIDRPIKPNKEMSNRYENLPDVLHGSEETLYKLEMDERRRRNLLHKARADGKMIRTGIVVPNLTPDGIDVFEAAMNFINNKLDTEEKEMAEKTKEKA